MERPHGGELCAGLAVPCAQCCAQLGDMLTLAAPWGLVFGFWQTCRVLPVDVRRFKKKHVFHITGRTVHEHRRGALLCEAYCVLCMCGQAGQMKPVALSADSIDELNTWMSLLLCACVPTSWPGEARHCHPHPSWVVTTPPL